MSNVATDVGLWMSLPAFGPAFLVAGVVIYVVRRDRRREAEALNGGDESPREGNGVE
ncbi:hypothetical protein [Mycolicibacterium hodleri]|uniref:hypothetical protein n=1 Tax=Mycolicibacterium hodleri TaxID=49897 RepID=UPI001F31D3FB|nr:hypothetical protein [Mycolicibacterium hodleri]